jgi:hypothetical protein
VLATGVDRHYIALRAGVEADDRDNLNPYLAAYWSYVMTYGRLVLAQALWATQDRAGEAHEGLAVARNDDDRRSAQQAIAFFSKATQQ